MWIIKAMGKLQSQSTSNPCSIAQAAAAAALGGPQQFLDDRNAAFRKRRDVVVAMLNDAPGLSCPVPDGAFYVYPDASDCMGKKTPSGHVIDTDEALIDYFLDSARVAAVHGGAFGLSPHVPRFLCDIGSGAEGSLRAHPAGLRGVELTLLLPLAGGGKLNPAQPPGSPESKACRLRVIAVTDGRLGARHILRCNPSGFGHEQKT